MSKEGSRFEFLRKRIDEILKNKMRRDSKLKAICRLLKTNVPYYDFVGFYFVDANVTDELVLGPFEGEPTEHLRIAFGRGICGQAAEQKKMLVIQNVAEETNYLSCSPKVKSEIVVPIFKNGKIVGELDIDSHTLSPFTVEDEVFLKELSEKISKIL